MSGNRKIPKRVLLSRLESWSLKYGLEEDPYLSSVRQAITKSASLPFWANLDPEENLPRPRAHVGDQFIRFARFLSLIRNVTVFMPVAITWKAISEATNAFATFTANKSAAPVNFLEFWQDGFGYLDSKWKIGNVAELDFLIIVGIVLLTLVSTWLLNYGRHVNTNQQRVCDRERQVVVLEMKSYFSSPKRMSKKDVDQSLATALTNLTSATEAISIAASHLASSVKAEPEIQEIQREIGGFFNRLGQILKVKQ